MEPAKGQGSNWGEETMGRRLLLLREKAGILAHNRKPVIPKEEGGWMVCAGALPTDVINFLSC